MAPKPINHKCHHFKNGSNGLAIVYYPIYNPIYDNWVFRDCQIRLRRFKKRQSRFIDYLRGSVTSAENEGTAIIFISDLIMTKLVDKKKINYDANFFVVPKLSTFFHFLSGRHNKQ